MSSSESESDDWLPHAWIASRVRNTGLPFLPTPSTRGLPGAPAGSLEVMLGGMLIEQLAHPSLLVAPTSESLPPRCLFRNSLQALFLSLGLSAWPSSPNSGPEFSEKARARVTEVGIAILRSWIRPGLAVSGFAVDDTDPWYP